jgi:hypothetical protein
MKTVKTIIGVVAEYNGKYWGTQYADEKFTVNEFGDIKNAKICDPKYCLKPTDMTWDPKNTLGNNHEYDLLKNAKLVKIKKIITTEIELELK